VEFSEVVPGSCIGSYLSSLANVAGLTSHVLRGGGAKKLLREKLSVLLAATTLMPMT
jgi:hypothetical protein